MKRLVLLASLLLACAAPVAAQPTYQTLSTATAVGPAFTINGTDPSGVSAGDLLVACVSATMSTNDTTQVSSPGWTHVATIGGTANAKIGMLWRAYSSGSPGPYTFTLAAAGTPSQLRATVIRISGADTSAPSSATAAGTAQNGSNSTNRVYPSITTADPNTLAIGCLRWSANDSTYTPDGALTNRQTATRAAVDTVVRGSSGATPVYTGSGTNTTYASVIWAIKPGVSNTSPTVTLSSPANAATGQSRTPALTFSCTDADGDTCRFNVQLTDNPDSFTAGETLTASLSTGATYTMHPQPSAFDTSPTTGNIQLDDRACQSFTAKGGRLTKASFYFGEDDVDPTKTNGTFLVRLHGHEGTFGTSSRPLNAPVPSPSGSATNGTNTPTAGWLAVSDGVSIVYPAAGGNAWRDASFTGANIFHLAPSTNYVVCQDWIPVDRQLRNTITVQVTTTSHHAGNFWIDGASANYGDGAGDALDEGDAWFRVYETFILLDEVSGTDAGFSGDLVASGASVTFTVQVADQLDFSATYYWRVRAIDPSGTNTYGAWSSTRSFTVQSSSPAAGGGKQLLLGVGVGGQQ